MSLKSLDIGKLDTPLVFYSPLEVVDSLTNERKLTYVQAFTSYASRVAKSAGERFEGRQQVSTQVEEYYIRYSADIKATWRIHDPDYGIMEVIGVQIHGRRNGLIITAELKDNIA